MKLNHFIEKGYFAIRNYHALFYQSVNPETK